MWILVEQVVQLIQDQYLVREMLRKLIMGQLLSVAQIHTQDKQLLVPEHYKFQEL